MTNVRTSVVFYALAAIAFGVVLQSSNGSVSAGSMGRSMAWLTLAVALCAAGASGWTPSLLKAANDRTVLRVLASGLLLQFVLLLSKRPAHSIPASDRTWLLPFAVGSGLAVAAVALPLWDWRRFGRWMMPVLVAIFIALGVWTIRHTPGPAVDVYAFQQESLRAFSRGTNPYAITMPLIYDDAGWYGSDLVQNGRLQVGLPYPPLSLLLELPSYLLLGDYRYATLLALALAALVLARCRDDALGPLAAAVLLFTPRAFFVIEQGWTEPFVALGLCLVAYASIRRPAWLPAALGFLFASKQYTLFLAPLVFVLFPVGQGRRAMSVLWRGVAIAVGIALPFAAWNPGAFFHSTVAFQFLQPFRPDSLSYLALYASLTGTQLPSWIGFAAMTGALVFVVWRGPRSASGFAAASAAVLLALFAFNKQAFCNYYFVVIAALCCAVGATPSVLRAAAPSRPR